MTFRTFHVPGLVRVYAPMPVSMLKAVAAVLFMLIIASCSGGEDSASSDLALSSEVDDEATPTPTSAPEADESDGLSESGSNAVEAPSSSTPTTEGSGLPPVVTSPVPQGGDPQRLYRGTIGDLHPDEQVTAAVADPPQSNPGVLPLTGYAGEVDDRPAITVKIDNGPGAAPHLGLNAADIVVEEEVEGGVTRLAAVFHSTSSIVGPVRSGRTTDIGLIGGFGDSVLLYSGANEITQQILADQEFIQLRSEGWSTGFWRDSNRRAPSNLFTDTAPHWGSATGTNPPQQFFYRDPDEASPGTAVEQFSVRYPTNTAVWEWDGSSWLRSQRGAQHLLGNGEQASASNVIVVEALEVATGMTDSSGGAVPEFVFVGSGPAVIYTDGKRIEGTWTRPTLTSVATYTTEAGETIELGAGRTWIQLVSSMGALS